MFTTLHAAFMEQYTELWNALDSIADRIRALAENANDQPTMDLLTQRIKLHEKVAWMLRSLRSLLQPVDRKIPMVSVGDVGRQVADTLRTSWSGYQVIELEGPQRYAPNDVAAALTEILGRPIKAEVMPREHWDPAFRSMGFTSGSAKAVSEMIDGFNSWIQFERPETTIRGATPLQTVLAALANPPGSL
jgi:hypothetical protein